MDPAGKRINFANCWESRNVSSNSFKRLDTRGIDIFYKMHLDVIKEVFNQDVFF